MRCVRQSPDVWSVDICLAGKCARGVMSDDPSRVDVYNQLADRAPYLQRSVWLWVSYKNHSSIYPARPAPTGQGRGRHKRAHTHIAIHTDELRGSEGHSIRTSTTHKRTRARNNRQREEIVWPGESRHTCAARLRRLSALSASLPGRIHLRSSTARCTHDE